MDCQESDILNFKPIKEGLTNTSFVFTLFDKKYVYRHPGDGTEAIVNREREKKALELAKKAGVDPTFICMNEKEGWKISSFVDNIRVPKYDNFEDCKQVATVLRQLHDKKLSVDWTFDPWNGLCDMENLVKENGGIHLKGYDELRTKIEKCYMKTVGDGYEPVFCHCDTYAPNWMLSDDKDAILIDWEYAANAMPGCDTGCFIMDSMYSIEEATEFIKAYLGDDYSERALFHHLAYTAIVSFYWVLWALYRESCGAVMGESLHNWYVMAVRYANYLTENM